MCYFSGITTRGHFIEFIATFYQKETWKHKYTMKQKKQLCLPNNEFNLRCTFLMAGEPFLEHSID